MRTILFDADVLAYRFGNSGVVDLDFGDGDGAELTHPDEAVEKALAHIEEVTEDCGSDDTILCWSDPEPYANFRLYVDNTYKWKRTRDDRPANYYAVRDRLTAIFESVYRPELEADDVMGILQTAPATSFVRKQVLGGGETIIVSVDKDMLQVPGYHYNPVTKLRTTVEAIDGDHLHMVQTLMGDQVDNYDGIPGIGIKKAEAILAPAGLDPVLEWELVVRAYIESNQWPNYDSYYDTPGRTPLCEATNTAIAQARLARILQWSDYDMKKKEPILWTPPSHG
jgi:DNA polymerase-1